MSDPFEPPAWLPADARAHHAELVADVKAKGLDPQPHHLLLLAQALAQYDRVTAFLNQHGMVLEIRNDKGEVKTQMIAPEAALQLKLLDKIRSLLKDVQLDGKEANEEETGQASGDRRRQAGRSIDAAQSGEGPQAQAQAGVDRLRARLAEAAGRHRPR